MNTYKPSVFNQIFWLVRDHLSPFVGQLNKYSKQMDVQSLLKVLLFSQITENDSLRHIETTLGSNKEKRYHLGIKTCARSTIAYWNNKVDSIVFEKLFYALLNRYKWMFTKSGHEIPIPVVILDSSLISLSLSLFDRAKHRTTKWGIRVHVGLELSDCIPRFIFIKNANEADNLIAKEAIKSDKLKPSEMIVFDRYYVDFDLRSMINESGAYFTTRTKRNTDYVITKEHVVNESNVLKDCTVELFSPTWIKKYPQPLRIVRYYDTENKREFEYITNNFELSAWTIAQIYYHRWRIEDFFKRIKQNLKIKSFLWTSENAVKNQIRVAMIYYLILQYLTYTASLWKKQILKLIRIIHEKWLNSIVLTEILAMCKSQSSLWLSISHPPPWSLFDF